MSQWLSDKVTYWAVLDSEKKYIFSCPIFCTVLRWGVSTENGSGCADGSVRGGRGGKGEQLPGDLIPLMGCLCQPATMRASVDDHFFCFIYSPFVMRPICCNKPIEQSKLQHTINWKRRRQACRYLWNVQFKWELPKGELNFRSTVQNTYLKTGSFLLCGDMMIWYHHHHMIWWPHITHDWKAVQKCAS